MPYFSLINSKYLAVIFIEYIDLINCRGVTLAVRLNINRCTAYTKIYRQREIHVYKTRWARISMYNSLNDYSASQICLWPKRAIVAPGRRIRSDVSSLCIRSPYKLQSWLHPILTPAPPAMLLVQESVDNNRSRTNRFIDFVLSFSLSVRSSLQQIRESKDLDRFTVWMLYVSMCNEGWGAGIMFKRTTLERVRLPHG